MKCPYCGSSDTFVTDTRKKVIEEEKFVETVYRRHKCKKCNVRFTTYEIYGAEELEIIRKNPKYNENAVDVPNIKYSRMVKK